MNIEIIQKRFESFLEKSWKLSDVTPFLFTYIRLLLLFKSELSLAKLDVISERKKQLLGEDFKGDRFDDMRKLSRKDMDRDIEKNSSETREAMINRLFFSALLDTEESDFFYLTEPMFEFVQNMKISPDQLRQILESEFVGFNGRS